MSLKSHIPLLVMGTGGALTLAVWQKASANEGDEALHQAARDHAAKVTAAAALASVLALVLFGNAR